MAADFEAELQQQLAEQQDALVGVQQLLEADPSSAETGELLAELQAGIQATEEALMGLKRQRLLAELDALHGDGHDDQQQQQQQQQQEGEEEEHQQQQPAVEEVGDRGDSHSAVASDPPTPGSICIFRHSDGRHHYGRVLAGSTKVAVHLEFCHPTRNFQLDPVTLPAAALQPAPGGSLQPAASQLCVGARVLVQPEGRKLWAAAELTQVDAAGQRIVALTLSDKRRHVLPLAAVVVSAYAPDPHASDDSGSESAGAALDISSGEGSSQGDGASSDSRGGDWEADVGQEDAEGPEEDEEEASVGFARVSLALEEAFTLLQQQAQAGPQTSTNLFFASETHSRGIGSKLLAKMGFRGEGHGLGRQQQGMQQALQATALKKGAGLGVDASGGTRQGNKKRKRSGKQRRRDRAAKAGLDQREAARRSQRELEQRTGSEGLFAVLNSMIGDDSVAQAVKNASLGIRSGGGDPAQADIPPVPAAASRKPARKEEDRRLLAQRGDELTQLCHKVQRLREMAARNAKDKVMLPQIRRALGEAEAQRSAAQQQHLAATKAIQSRDAIKRMTKF